jgi:hypothetical protein
MSAWRTSTHAILLAMLAILAAAPAGCGAGVPNPAPTPCNGGGGCCACPLQEQLVVADRGKGDLALFQSTGNNGQFGPALGTIPAPGAESLAGNVFTLYVGEYPNTVAIFQFPGGTAAGTITDGIADPAGLTSGPFGTGYALFVANRSANTITAYDLTTGKLQLTMTGLNAPNALTLDSQDNLWVAQAANVIEIKPPFSANPSAALTIANGVTQPSGLWFDENGNLYVTDKSKNALIVYAPGSTTPQASVSAGLNQPVNPYQIANEIVVPNLSGAITAYALPITSSSSPVSVQSLGLGQPSSITSLK